MNKHLETLKAYQAWRRDEGDTDPLTIPSVQEISEALDWAIAEPTDRPSENQLMEQAKTIKELRAHVERLRDSLNQKVIELVRCGIGANYSGKYYEKAIKEFYEPLASVVKETPAQSLAEIRAEAVERYGKHIGGSLQAFEECTPFEFANMIRQEAQ